MQLTIEKSKIKTVFAILVHEFTGYTGYYLEKVNFDESGNTTTPIPLDEETLISLGESLWKNKRKDAPIRCLSIIENQFLFIDQYAGRKKFIWVEPESIKEILTKNKNKSSKKKTAVPNTLFVANQNSLKVFAVKEFPVTSETILYQAPYMNTTKIGDVCMGSGLNRHSVKEMSKIGDINKLMDIFSNGFWNSYFTEFHNSTYPHKELWIEGKSAKKFNYNQLKIDPKKLKVKDLIK